jgi:hypothetical protein
MMLDEQYFTHYISAVSLPVGPGLGCNTEGLIVFAQCRGAESHTHDGVGSETLQ